MSIRANRGFHPICERYTCTHENAPGGLVFCDGRMRQAGGDPAHAGTRLRRGAAQPRRHLAGDGCRPSSTSSRLRSYIALHLRGGETRQRLVLALQHRLHRRASPGERAAVRDAGPARPPVGSAIAAIADVPGGHRQQRLVRSDRHGLCQRHRVLHAIDLRPGAGNGDRSSGCHLRSVSPRRCRSSVVRALPIRGRGRRSRRGRQRGDCGSRVV